LLNCIFSCAADSHWFRASGNIWGFKKLVALSELYEAAKGYIKDDTVIVEVQILVMSIAKIST